MFVYRYGGPVTSVIKINCRNLLLKNIPYYVDIAFKFVVRNVLSLTRNERTFYISAGLTLA